MLSSPHFSVQNGSGIAGNAHPFAVFVQPGIHEALAPHVTLTAFDSLGAKYPGRDSSIAKHMYAHGFRRDLLLLRVVSGRLYACQKLGLALDGAVIVDQHDLVVED